ncbi:hypothetical protein F8388_008226 [Cannabis sativa]|uniref:CCHC-type domain-containing protein n=1 Tax=Cannabis sativa TaxID=3483 RepID=A0A7J6EV82_CANSA|nr:hypothetical protein F8388_008226 [Cannabis sativa]KAF4391330.1 hypothetical protein G4B88_016640 [Cannabis sativa]
MGRVQSTISGDKVLDFGSIFLLFLISYRSPATYFLVFVGFGCNFLGWWGVILQFSGLFNVFLCSFFWIFSGQYFGEGCSRSFPTVFSLDSGVSSVFSLGLAAFFLAIVHRGSVLLVLLLCVTMDLELVNRLAEVLVLDEGDGPVLPLNQAGVEEGKKRLDLCLVGKVIGPKPINKEGIERAMKGIWRINNRFQVEELSSKNVFRFFFGSREDRQRVFGGGPWTIDKQLICFVKPMGLGEISKMNFDFTSFWISINNVPLACMTELFAREWGERIGKLEDIKLVNGTMKVRVRINITEPLKRGLRVAVDDQGNEVSLIFQYEHLPDFCFDCGIIGHKAMDCPLRDFAGENPHFDRGRFGSWMCAPSSPPRDRFRVQRNRENSPSNRPIMTMGEASRIVSAVEKNRARYSGPTPEELAPTSILEAREREEELASHDTDVTKIAVAPMGNVAVEVNVEGLKKDKGVGRDKSLHGTSSGLDSVTEMVIPVDDEKEVIVGEGDNGKGNGSTSVIVDLVTEMEVGERGNQKFTKEQKGKGVLAPSSQDELSFSHALQHTFEPLIKAQKAKTWKRINSSSSRGSKGVSKLSSFPISPKLSHVMVANAKYKLSPKANGGGKRKMDIEGATESGQCFTWLNKRQGVAHVQERLDRFCCNQDWHDLFPSVRVTNGDFLHSDHRPVVATLENVVRIQKNDKKRCFRFETHWLKDEECHDIVNHTWSEVDVPLDSQDSILGIFGRCAERLGAWNKDKFGSIPRRVRETQKQLDDLLSVAAPLVRMDEVKRLETTLNDLLSREECYWKLRSRADWLALGDRNTKYFHNKATGRKKKNAIVEMMTEDGQKLTLEEDIVNEIERYFGTIFSSASPSAQQEV